MPTNKLHLYEYARKKRHLDCIVVMFLSLTIAAASIFALYTRDYHNVTIKLPGLSPMTLSLSLEKIYVTSKCVREYDDYGPIISDSTAESLVDTCKRITHDLHDVHNHVAASYICSNPWFLATSFFSMCISYSSVTLALKIISLALCLSTVLSIATATMAFFFSTLRTDNKSKTVICILTLLTLSFIIITPIPFFLIGGQLNVVINTWVPMLPSFAPFNPGSYGPGMIIWLICVTWSVIACLIILFIVRKSPTSEDTINAKLYTSALKKLPSNMQICKLPNYYDEEDLETPEVYVNEKQARKYLKEQLESLVDNYG